MLTPSWRVRKRRHETTVCPMRYLLTYREFLQSESKKTLEDEMKLLGLFDNAVGWKEVGQLLEPMQLEGDIYQIHLTERMAEHYYGLNLKQLVQYWETWEDVSVEWVCLPTLAVCRGIKKVLDRILAWVKTHSGHNEFPVLYEGVAALNTGLRHVVSERSQMGLALRGESQ